MNEIFDRNKILLEKHQPNTYKKLVSYINGKYKSTNKSIDSIRLAQKDDMVINMILLVNEKEYLLFDHEDPIGQAYGWIDKYIDPSNKAEIIFGMGFGFHIEVLLSSFKNKKVLVIEPNIDLFFQVLQVRNLELIIEKAKIFVDEEINTVLKNIYTLYWDTKEGGIQCQPLEIYAEIFNNQWEELSDKFVKQAQSFNVDIATRRYFGDLWINNYIKNLTKISHASQANGLVGKFRGIPGIVVSAGPSLEKNMHLLLKMKESCVIMAAGTAVSVLEKKGIISHFMVGIDASESEAQLIKSVKSCEIGLIYSNQIATECLEYYQGPKFLMNYSIDTYTFEFLKFSGVKSECFQSGPSVSNTCFDILYRMGCNPIIFVGQDLSFTQRRVYAGESLSIPTNDLGNERMGYILTKDIFNNDIYTSMSFLAMKNHFEAQFERVKDKVEIVNATEGGLNIKFARNDTLEKLINSYNFERCNIEIIIKDAYNNNQFSGEVEGNLKGYITSIIAEIDRLEAFCKKQLHLVDLIKRGVYHPAKDKKAFDKIVKQVSEFTDLTMESSIYNSILSNLLHIDFYLIKVEVERAINGFQNYEEVKDFYIHAIIKQNELLNEKLQKVREHLVS